LWSKNDPKYIRKNTEIIPKYHNKEELKPHNSLQSDNLKRNISLGKQLAVWKYIFSIFMVKKWSAMKKT